MAELKASPDSWLVRRYFSLRRRIDYLTHSIRALHQAIWLGLLNRRQLAELTEWRYQQWSVFTDSGYNLSGLEKWEKEAVDRYFDSCGSVLIGAAGGGREAVALSQRGMKVSAFECSKVLAETGNEILRAANVETRIQVAKPDELPEGLGTYDGFIMGWGGYMHIIGEVRRIAFLEQCRQHLADRAPILLSFFTRSTDSRIYRWTRRIANVIGRLRPGSEPVEMGDLLEHTLNHSFTKEEIRSELEAAGFEMLHYAEEPYGHALGRLVGKEGG